MQVPELERERSGPSPLAGAAAGDHPVAGRPACPRVRTSRIRVAVDGTWQLIQDAYLTRTWAPLGYASWDDYCTREFGTSRLRLPREERQEVVASLREIGMSTRAIGAATGYSEATVRRELSGASSDAPQLDSELSDAPAPEPATEPAPDDEQATVTGTDGKQYRVKSGSTSRRATTSTPGASRPRPPLPTQFRTTAIAGAP